MFGLDLASAGYAARAQDRRQEDHIPDCSHRCDPKWLGYRLGALAGWRYSV